MDDREIRQGLTRPDREQFDYLTYYEQHAPETLTDEEKDRLNRLRERGTKVMEG